MYDSVRRNVYSARPTYLREARPQPAEGESGAAKTIVSWQGRFRLLALIATLILLLAACGGDNGGPPRQTTTPSRAAGPTTDGTAFIAPSPYALDEALAELDAIEEMIRNPDQDLITQLNIDPAAVQQRTSNTFEGVTNVPGLNEVRRLLTEATPETEHGSRILAGETLRNITDATIIPPFSDADADAIPPAEIAELDPLHIWAVDPEDGLPTTALWKEAVARIIALWYRL